MNLVTPLYIEAPREKPLLFLLSEATNARRVMFFISSNSFSYSATYLKGHFARKRYVQHIGTVLTMFLLHTCASVSFSQTCMGCLPESWWWC
jgi:hypothetical protein